MSSPNPQYDPFEPVIYPQVSELTTTALEELRLEKIMDNAKEEEERMLREADKYPSLGLND